MQHIPEVLVQAEYIREVLKPQRLSGKLLEGLSTHSVADAIRYFSGVQIKDYGGVGGVKTVNIRSMGSHHVGVFYDGIQLGNAQNGQIDLGKYSLDNMETVSVYAGQKSDLFSRHVIFPLPVLFTCVRVGPVLSRRKLQSDRNVPDRIFRACQSVGFMGAKAK